MKKTSIAIVGGGMAGLSAAFRLVEHERISVTVFEAEHHLGGRVHHRTIRGHAVDFGGFLIYPWYTECLDLFRTLNLTDRLTKTPLSDIYYLLGDDTIGKRDHDLEFSKRDMITLWAKSLMKLLPDTELAHPDLDRFHNATISEYLRTSLHAHAHAGIYETFFDTVNQGYCYGAVTQTKAAFMAPIVRQVTLHGDIRSTSFLPDGSGEVLHAIEKEILRRGGVIHKNTPVTHVSGHTINHDASRTFDGILFAQTVSQDIYRQILPGIEPDCWYTQYLTVAVECDNTPSVGNTHTWGAAFYEPHAALPLQTHSVINLASLCGSDLRNCLMLNIAVRSPQTAVLSGRDIHTLVAQEVARLFPAITVTAVLDSVHWKKTMPIAQESFVAAVRDAQGKHGYYFAGDYLGAPSIETAVATGRAAANAILHDMTEEKGSTHASPNLLPQSSSRDILLSLDSEEIRSRNTQ